MSRRGHSIGSDRARFENVYGETRVPILGYLVRRTANPEDAADLLAEVYLIAWRRINDLPAGDEARLWLFGVARRVLANHHRRMRTQTGLALALQDELRFIGRDSADARDSQAEAVQAALAELGSRDRELLTLNAWEGLTPVEIATVLGRPAGLVRVQLHRARNRLRCSIADRPVSDAALGLVPDRRSA